MDIIVRNELNKEEIRDMLSKVFEVEKNQVLVKNNIFETEPDKYIKILCEPFFVDWDFKTRLEIYLKDRNDTKEELLRTVSKICEILKCDVLIDDCSYNPFTMFKVERISVDMNKFDAAKEYDN